MHLQRRRGPVSTRPESSVMRLCRQVGWVFLRERLDCPAVYGRCPNGSTTTRCEPFHDGAIRRTIPRPKGRPSTDRRGSPNRRGRQPLASHPVGRGSRSAGTWVQAGDAGSTRRGPPVSSTSASRTSLSILASTVEGTTKLKAIGGTTTGVSSTVRRSVSMLKVSFQRIRHVAQVTCPTR